MKNSKLEFVVGLFLLIGTACIAYLSVRVARSDFFAEGGYEVRAMFGNCSGIRHGSPVMIAGVEVGRVKEVRLEEYEARVRMTLNPDVLLQKDAIASIKTKGLIGEKFIEITPGASDEMIQPGGLIHDTEPALDIERLISKFVHGNLNTVTNTSSAK